MFKVDSVRNSNCSQFDKLEVNDALKCIIKKYDNFFLASLRKQIAQQKSVLDCGNFHAASG